MMTSPESLFPVVRVRPVGAADIGAVARLFARLNAAAETRCLHAGGGGAEPADARPGLAEGTFVLAERVTDGEIIGATGVLPGLTGLTWGPSVLPTTVADRPEVGHALLRELFRRLPDPAARRGLDAFPDEANRTLRQTLRDAGFREGQRTHVFVAPRPEGAVRGPFGEELRERHAAAFARLHAETFPTDPAEGTDADALLAGRDGDERRIFAVPDASGLRLLGYVCASVGQAPREGFIEFLAVRENARGRGVGGRLLRTAQRWFFDELGLPQAALCVSEWRAERGGARRLYEREGFIRRFTGVGMRWRR